MGLDGVAVQVGGQWYREKHDYLSIPLYVRENTILALGARDDDAVYDYADGVQLRVYALQDGKTAETVVYSGDNQIQLRARVTRQGNRYTARVEADKPCTLTLMNLGHPTSATAPYHQSGPNLTFPLPTSTEFSVTL